MNRIECKRPMSQEKEMRASFFSCGSCKMMALPSGDTVTYVGHLACRELRVMDFTGCGSFLSEQCQSCRQDTVEYGEPSTLHFVASRTVEFSSSRTRELTVRLAFSDMRDITTLRPEPCPMVTGIPYLFSSVSSIRSSGGTRNPRRAACAKRMTASRVPRQRAREREDEPFRRCEERPTARGMCGVPRPGPRGPGRATSASGRTEGPPGS